MGRPSSSGSNPPRPTLHRRKKSQSFLTTYLFEPATKHSISIATSVVILITALSVSSSSSSSSSSGGGSYTSPAASTTATDIPIPPSSFIPSSSLVPPSSLPPPSYQLTDMGRGKQGPFSLDLMTSSVGDAGLGVYVSVNSSQIFKGSVVTIFGERIEPGE